MSRRFGGGGGSGTRRNRASTPTEGTSARRSPPRRTEGASSSRRLHTSELWSSSSSSSNFVPPPTPRVEPSEREAAKEVATNLAWEAHALRHSGKQQVKDQKRREAAELEAKKKLDYDILIAEQRSRDTFAAEQAMRLHHEQYMALLNQNKNEGLFDGSSDDEHGSSS